MHGCVHVLCVVCAYAIRPNVHFWPIRLSNCPPVKRSAGGEYACVSG